MSYRMKAVMEKTGLTEKAIRYYIDKGLINPEVKKSNGRINYYFNEIQLQALDEICILRSYGFTIQNIKAAFTGDSKYIQNMLKDYFCSLERQQKYASAWSKIPIDLNEIESKEQLIDILRKHQNTVWKETQLQPNYTEIYEDENKVAPRVFLTSKAKINITIFVIILLTGLILGIILGSVWKQNIIARETGAKQFHYGLTQNNITVTDIEWKEFPNYRKVSFHIQGSFAVNIPPDAEIVLGDLQNDDSLWETGREHQVISDGEQLLYYDSVTYEINDGFIESTGILKADKNPIVAATQGYRLMVSCEDGDEYFLGYIPTQSSFFENWTIQQSEYAKKDLTPYLSAFTISRTYDDYNTLSAINAAGQVELIKKERGLLDCVIKNKGTTDWEYCAGLPSLEMWYRGVWIELKPEWDDSLVASSCPGMQDKEITVPTDITEEYPDLFSGLYRLVIYGTKGDYVISDTFVIKEK